MRKRVKIKDGILFFLFSPFEGSGVRTALTAAAATATAVAARRFTADAFINRISDYADYECN